MQLFISFLASGTARRLIVFIVGAAIVALNKKLGLNLDQAEAVTLATMTLGYITQSAVKEASDNHADAKVHVAEIAKTTVPGVTTQKPPIAAPDAEVSP